MNTNTTTAARTFYRLESRSADGVKMWEKRNVSVNLETMLASLRSSADEQPQLNWRVVSGSPFGDDRDPIRIYATRGAV